MIFSFFVGLGGNPVARATNGLSESPLLAQNEYYEKDYLILVHCFYGGNSVCQHV